MIEFDNSREGKRRWRRCLRMGEDAVLCYRIRAASPIPNPIPSTQFFSPAVAGLIP